MLRGREMIVRAAGALTDPAHRPLSDVLAELPRDRSVTLGETLGAMGTRAHGCALILLALPDALPIPVPSLSAILGLPLVVISAHLVAFGDRGRLPQRAFGLVLPQRLVGALRDRVAPVLRKAERLSHPRWQPVAGHDRTLAIVCLYLSALLLLPLPFFNTPPALCLLLVAWGMVQRDGVFVLAGLIGTAGLTAALAWLAERLGALAATAAGLAL